ncbi:hypothetical protein VHUM_03412 [Vanrija humicola]|uniref:Pyruvate decarboxylase n=1 Tax=Vanrija humicola TaxID=5417 RepID=A0A7D8YUG3_VANHU|nr:hypothetical protein VHUM_03412 [Vanrija humicola]
MTDTIEFASYIVERLKQTGVKQVFGVPGDYNLEFLDYIEKDPVLNWVGNANELNAAYAADGYARIKGGLAVLVTTFGVGELSALCGVAGSLSERLPVLHIVGAPSTRMQRSRALLHHTLNTPSSFTAFTDMSKQLSCSMALLNQVSPDTPNGYVDAFDETLRQCLTQCRPGYVELPMDAVRAVVSTRGLNVPLPDSHAAPSLEALRQLTPPGTPSPINKLYKDFGFFEPKPDEVTEHVVKIITRLYEGAQRPIVLVDACAARFGMGPIIRHLVEACGIRFFTTPMGKGILDEHHPLYGGCYAGRNSLQPVRDEVEASDFVLYVGSLKSDFNSGSFSVHIDDAHAVKLHSYTTQVGYAEFPTTDIRHVLPLLVGALEGVKSERPRVLGESLEQKMKQGRVATLVNRPEGTDIVHKWLWPRVGSWFHDNDIIVTETGTSSFGLLPVPLPSHASYNAQVLWGSIGWSVGATLGAALAAEEEPDKRRTVLFVGDGSLQLTVQEIGTMVRRGLHPYLFVLNNDGYEIERQIHGATAQYNNIQMYDHQLLLPFLAGKNPATPFESHVVRTQDELHALLLDDKFNVPDRIRLIEVVMPRGDAPEPLLLQARLTAEANSGH